MAKQRGQSLFDLNFDSLTDTITNLAGTLILVVVIVFGISSPAARTAGTPAAGRTADTRRSLEPLMNRAAQLQQETQQLGDEVRQLEQTVHGLRDKARRPESSPAPPSKPATGEPPLPPSAPATPVPPAPKTAKPTRIARVETSAWEKAAEMLTVVQSADLLWVAGAALLVVGDEASRDRQNGPSATAEEVPKPLLEQAHARLQQTGDALSDQEGRLARLRETIDRLRQGLQDQAPGQKPQPRQSPGKPPPKDVAYHPPLEQFTRQEPIEFLCQEGRISYLDLDAIRRQVKLLEPSGKVSGSSARSFEFDLADSDFRVRGSFHEAGKGTDAQLEVFRKPNHPGETWEDIQRPGSRFQKELRRIQARSPKNCFVDFCVWPDSYETFRRARSLAWQAGYDVNWSAERAGLPLKLIRQVGPVVRIKQAH